MKKESQEINGGIGTSDASWFILMPLIKNNEGEIPNFIPLQEIAHHYSTSMSPIIVDLLTKRSGLYSKQGNDLQLTPKGLSAKLKTGQSVWMASSVGAMFGGARSMDGVILASKLIGESTTYGPYLEEISKILAAGDITQIVEIGQGAGKIICSQLVSNPDLIGTALDLDPAATRLTKNTSDRLGVSERLCILTGDINDGIPLQASAGKVLVIAGFVFHDFTNIAKGLKALSSSIPVGSRILLAELCSDRADDPFSIAILGYHEKIGIHIPTTLEWEQKFQSAGFSILKKVTDGCMGGARIFSLEKTNPNREVIQAVRKVFNGHTESVPAIDFKDDIPRIVKEVAFVDMSKYPTGISQAHVHDCDETYIITSGTVQIVIDEEILQVKGPCGLHIPAGHKHSWKPLDVRSGDHIIGMLTKNGGDHD